MGKGMEFDAQTSCANVWTDAFEVENAMRNPSHEKNVGASGNAKTQQTKGFDPVRRIREPLAFKNSCESLLTAQRIR
jgi:hypothetical protein